MSTLIGLWAGFFGSAWLSSSVRGTHSLVRDLGLRFRWIDLVGVPIGVGGQFLVALMYIPIAQHVSNFNQRFDAPSQRLTGGSHGGGLHADRHLHGGRGSLLRRAVLPRA